MITPRKSSDRGHFDHGWLKTYHTFSFADYHDENFMGFRVLRVINEDWVEKGQGFGTHPHRDMEIITYVIEGALAHKDSMGNGSEILPGDVQYMSAGSGVTHSEFNASKEGATHLLQIWILPNERGAKPRYDQKQFSAEAKKNQLKLVASGKDSDGVVTIRQDMQLYASILEPQKSVSHSFAKGRGGWIQVIRGDLKTGDSLLKPGDGAAIEQEAEIRLSAGVSETEFLLFDLP